MAVSQLAFPPFLDLNLIYDIWIFDSCVSYISIYINTDSNLTSDLFQQS